MARRPITFRVDMFEPICSGNNITWSENGVFYALELLAYFDTVQLSCKLSKLPSIYECFQRGMVKYMPDPPDEEAFCGILEILRNGGGDCEDLAAWRIAELRLRGSPYYPNGEPANFHVLKFNRPGKSLLYHIQVRRAPTPEHPDPNDPMLIEDPSVLLGMPT